MSLDTLLTPDETATYLKVSVQTVWRWCRQGTLPAVKIGKYWRVDRKELDRFIASQTPSAPRHKEAQHHG
jgi:excisionase family DNA binding protein